VPHIEYSDDDGRAEVVQDNDMVGREETPGVLIVRVRDDLDFGVLISPFPGAQRAHLSLFGILPLWSL
jgi:hypothetical protein